MDLPFFPGPGCSAYTPRLRRGVFHFIFGNIKEIPRKIEKKLCETGFFVL